MKLQPAHFTLDSLGDVLLDGFTAGETWNGWECPYFTFQQARKVVDAFNASQRVNGDSVEARYDATQDAFCFFFESAGESDDFSAVEIEGKKYYPIGAYAWIWESTDRLERQSQTGNAA